MLTFLPPKRSMVDGILVLLYPVNMYLLMQKYGIFEPSNLKKNLTWKGTICFRRKLTKSAHLVYEKTLEVIVYCCTRAQLVIGAG